MTIIIEEKLKSYYLGEVVRSAFWSGFGQDEQLLFIKFIDNADSKRLSFFRETIAGREK